MSTFSKKKIFFSRNEKLLTSVKNIVLIIKHITLLFWNEDELYFKNSDSACFSVSTIL